MATKSIFTILIHFALAALGLVMLLMHRVKDYEALHPWQATAGCSRSFFTGSVKGYGGVHVRPIRDVTVVGLLLFASVVPVALPRYGGWAAYFTVHPIYGGAQPTPSCLSNLFAFVRFKEKAPKDSHICHTCPLKELLPTGYVVRTSRNAFTGSYLRQSVVFSVCFKTVRQLLDERPLFFV